MPRDPSASADHGPVGQDRDLIRAAMREAIGVVAHASSSGKVPAGRHAPASPASDDGSPIIAPSSDSLPGYDITREIHRGGQGVVYQAIQKATRRKVAIKVMREGPFASARDRARFEREVHILSQLNHPNIVAVHDSGEASGHFFFVMDYIPGHRLDTYMASGERSVKDALRLFIKICDAVNVAHLRGIIHRDLKPGNIRVDPSGEPHILDFGLAKVSVFDVLADSRPDVMTITGQFVGSLPWASPEQADGAPDRIDIRTDVYSLGVILFQMLTSRFPYEVVGNMRDVLGNILTSPPIRPSTLRREVDDEVETIVLKCLSKERDRRYQSAGELARDVRHYLAGEPIEAKRDSVGYMLRKQLRRYRLPVAVAVAFVALVTVGFAASAVLWKRAVDQRDRAVEAEQKQAIERRLADAARNASEISEQDARSEAAKAGAVTAFLQQMLQSVNPDNALGREVTVHEALQEAARGVDDGSLASQPEVEAAIRDTIGNTYIALGLYKDAEPHLRRALALREQVHGAEHPDVAKSLDNLANVRSRVSDFESAETLSRQALAMRRRLLGPDHLDIVASLNNLGLLLSDRRQFQEAEQLLREALTMRGRITGDLGDDAAVNLGNLAIVLQAKGDVAAAEPLFRKALEIWTRTLGENHPQVADGCGNLAAALNRLGRFNDAEPLYRRALAINRQVLGPRHPALATSINNLALALKQAGALDEAEQLCREALSIYVESYGERHPRTGTGFVNLGALLEARGRHDEALAMYDQALEAFRQGGVDYLGEQCATLSNIGRALHRYGKPKAAEPVIREALQLRRRLVSPSDPKLADTLNLLGVVLTSLRRLDEAEAAFREAIAIQEAAIGQPPAVLSSYLNNFGTAIMAGPRPAEAEPLFRHAIEINSRLEAYGTTESTSAIVNYIALLKKLDRAPEALPLYEQVLALRRAKLGPEHPDVTSVMNNYAMLLHKVGRSDEALAVLRDLVRIQSSSQVQGQARTMTARQNLAAILIARKEWAEAETVLRELLPIRVASLPADDARIANTQLQLGAAIAELRRFEEAEPLLLAAEQSLRENAKATAASKRRAVQKIVALYAAWGRPDEEAQWRQRLPEDSGAAPEPDADDRS